jgi:hypothetical protein
MKSIGCNGNAVFVDLMRNPVMRSVHSESKLNTEDPRSVSARISVDYYYISMNLDLEAKQAKITNHLSDIPILLDLEATWANKIVCLHNMLLFPNSPTKTKMATK